MSIRKLFIFLFVITGVILFFSQQSFIAVSTIRKKPLFTQLQIKVENAKSIRGDDTYIGAPLEALFDGPHRESFVKKGGYTPFLNFGMLSFNQRSHFISLYEAPFLVLQFQTARNYRYLLIFLTAIIGMYSLLGFVVENSLARWAGSITYGFSAHALVWLVGAHQLALAGALIPVILVTSVRFIQRPAPLSLFLFFWGCWELILCHYPPSQLFAGYFLVVLFVCFYLWHFLAEPEFRKQTILAGALLGFTAIISLYASWFAWYPRAEDIITSTFAQRNISTFANARLVPLKAWPLQWFFFQDNFLPFSNICELSFGTNFIATLLSLLLVTRIHWVKDCWNKSYEKSGAAAGIVWIGALLSLFLQILIYFPGGLAFLSPLPYTTAVNPNRIFLLFAFAPAVFMALAWQKLLDEANSKLYKYLGVLLILSAVNIYISSIYQWLQGIWINPIVQRSFLISGIFLVLIRQRKSSWAPKAALGLYILFILNGFWIFEPRAKQVDWKHPHPAIKVIKQELQNDFFYTIFINGIMPWNTSGFFQIPTLNGYDIYAEEIQRWYAALDGNGNRLPNAGGIDFSFDNSVRSINNNRFKIGKNLALLSHFNTRFIVAPHPIEIEDLALYRKYEEIYVYEYKGYKPRIQAPSNWERLSAEQLETAVKAYRKSAPEPRYIVNRVDVPSDLESCSDWSWHPNNMGEGNIKFDELTPSDCLLFVAAKFKENYVFFSEKSVTKFPVNKIFTGIIVPKGIRQITMNYIDPAWSRYSIRFWLGLLLFSILILGLGKIHFFKDPVVQPKI